ncbi:MAG: OmpA family protein [Candidatus Aminicenantes bacterium]|nr:OmpA family protein [Candidatus Aminicenantes bacterium]
MKKIVTFGLVAAFLLAATGCSMNKAGQGAVIGAGSGAVVGGVIGRAAGNTIAGAIIGAAVGGAAGAFIGNYMDRQAAEIRKDIEGAKVERIGEGIKITFESGLLFDVDKSELRPASKENLTELARILNKYEDTNILIEGHTDSTGSEEYNMNLSKSRAESVSAHLAMLEVKSPRFTVVGYGEMQPIALNDTEEGRQFNRRVDIAIMANEKLKKAAKEQTQG